MENDPNLSNFSNMDETLKKDEHLNKDTSEKPENSVIFIGDQEVNKCSLQESFLKFRQQKIRERQIMKISRQEINGKRSDAFKENLRAKFVETAKKYLGVPYSQKYKKEEDPVAPLYLDCCGLVRQSLKDLQDEFGFIIGKWNQAYQMDTLPIILEENQLKPGDLIFYEGIYTSDRAKPQKHNNVHVEIFLGGETGEATIGSRFRTGTVSIFPSYKFESSVWKLVKYHYRSIETWLDGECKSHCPEHPWNSDSLAYLEAAGKKSIFSDDSLDDIDAGGEDEQETYYQQDGEPYRQEEVDSCLKDDNCISSNKTIDIQPDSDDIKNHDEVPIILKSSSQKIETEASISNKPKRVSKYRVATSHSEKVSSSNKLNNQVEIRSKAVPKTYYISKCNGWKIVKKALDKRGWQQLPFDYSFSNRFGLKWVERRSQIDYMAHNPGQLVCHIPNNDIITSKIGLLCTMKSKYCNKPSGTRCQPPWLPETYDLESPADCMALIETEGNLLGDSCQGNEVKIKSAELNENHSNIKFKEKLFNNGGIWIYKPSCFNRGRGIRLVTGIDNLREICMTREDGGPPPKGIIQRYITNPLLVGQEGYKFDIRCYLLIARNFPTTLAFFRQGYCRLALKPYDISSEKSISDVSVHLTNAAVQKKGDKYKEQKEFQIQTLESIADSLESIGKNENANYIRNALDYEIKTCLSRVMEACNSKLLKKHGYFDLLGCDFMLTDSNKLYLLEINTNPALTLDNQTLADMLPGIVDGAIEIVLGLQGPERNSINQDELLKNLPDGYSLIFDEAKNYKFGKMKKVTEKKSQCKSNESN